MIAADHARFGFAEVKRGIMPGGGGTQQLPRAIGVRRAKEIIFTGDMFNAEEAMRYGLLNHVYPQDQLYEQTMSLVKRILANAPVAVRQAKNLSPLVCRWICVLACSLKSRPIAVW